MTPLLLKGIIIHKLPACTNRLCISVQYSELHKTMFWLFNALGADSLKGSRNMILITGVNHIC